MAQSLEVALGAKECRRLEEAPTSSLAAYDAFLRGRETEEERSDIGGYRRAAAQYEQAVALDPRFALAWARLSVARSRTYFNTVPTAAEAEAA